MAKVLHFKRNRRRSIPRNVFLPVFLVLGVLLNFVDWSALDQSNDVPGPRVLRGGDALNSGQHGLGGFATAPRLDATSRSQPGRLIDRVTRVRDGDTIVVGLIPVRIANLDCAESGTYQGEVATQLAKELTAGATVTCDLEGRRSHDREVGVCKLPDGRDFDEVLISVGACERW